MNNDKRTTREGWYNRHLTALPNKECVINIIHKDIDGEHEHLCEWKPFNKSEYTSANMPGEGYLGTATVIKPPFEGIGFHAWEQNNSQFIYYKIIEHPTTETETKKEKGKEGDILEGMNIIAKIVDYCFDKIDADLLSSKQEFHRLVSIKAHLKNNEDCRLISLAPQLAKENKELKEQIDKIAAELRRAKTFEELAEDTIKEKEKENKSLREANERMKEAFSELMRFKNVMETGADTLQYPDNFLKAIDEAKQALNQ